MYYPLSQITPNLYSNNDLAYKLSGVLYTGYYFKISTGKYYTGRNTSDRPNEELIFVEKKPDSGTFDLVTNTNPSLNISPESIQTTLSVTNYLNLPGTNNSASLVPIYLPNTPTQQDYQNEEFQRYFCKKTNEIQYIEINLDQFTKLKAQDPQILYQLYQPFTITWILTGNKDQVAKTNKNIVELASFRQKLPRFGDYIRFDYTKYYQFPNISNLYTSGSEFKTANGQNYIGFYHIYDKTGPMIGATHTKEPHGLLFPINKTIIPQVINQQTSQVITQTTSSYTLPITTTGGSGGFSSGGGGGGGGGY